MPAVSNKSIAAKLGIKDGKTVMFVNEPSGYEKILGAVAPGARVVREAIEPVDIIQVFVDSRKNLEHQLPRMKKLMKSTSALWVSYYKGTSKNKTDINRDSINEYANSIGLEGVAIMSVDDDWSSLRLKRLV